MASPKDFVRSRGDAITILVLWCLRTTSWTLLLIGMTILLVSHRLDENLASQLDSPVELANSLTTPLAGVAIGLILRAGAAILAWVSAAPLVLQEVPPLVPLEGMSRWARWTDRWRQISASAAVRGTWAVRQEAIQTVGRWGLLLRYADIGLRVACVAAAAGLLVAALVVSP